MRHFLPAAVLAVAFCHDGSAQNVPAPERFRSAREAIAAEVANGNAPSIAVAVLEDGAVVWAEGFGLADREQHRQATADTIYRLASISKPFTATAVMQLVERGLVELDTPVNRYLDAKLIAYRSTADQITLRRLLNHTAGLPTHWNFFFGSELPPARVASIRAYGFAAFEPGTRTNYSNFAFGVLDHVVARLGGKGYRAWLCDELLDPLGMEATDVGVRPGREAHAARGYQKADGQWRVVDDYGFDHDGASAMRSSANDLMRFARLQLGRGAVDGVRVLAEQSALAMRERRGRDAGSDFGIGWSVARTRGQPVLQHSGGMPGVSTQLLVFPDRDAALTVLTNGGNRGATHRSVQRILDVLFGDQENARATDEPPATRGPSREAGSEAEPGRYRGQIAHPTGSLPVALEVDADGSTRLAVADGPLQRCRTRTTATAWTIACRHALPIGHASEHDTDLSIELTATEMGLSGVLYATADGICRLPFWIELVREVDKPAQTLRVVSYNVLVGWQDSEVGRFLPGALRRQRASAWLAAMRPDVVALQEMNGFDEAGLRRLAAAWGHGHVAMLKTDGYPVALTSSSPIKVIARHREGLHHGMLHATSHGVDFVVVHFVPSPNVPKKLAECERALACYRQAAENGRPAIVLGDFNSISPDDVDRFSDAARERYQKWGYLLVDGRPAEIAITPLLTAGARDVCSARPDELPLPRIDFVLASPELAQRCTAGRWLCEPEHLRWSDHPPVFADFAVAAGTGR